MPANQNNAINISNDLSSASTGVNNISQPRSNGINDMGVVDPSPVLGNTVAPQDNAQQVGANNNQPQSSQPPQTNPGQTGQSGAGSDQVNAGSSQSQQIQQPQATQQPQPAQAQAQNQSQQQTAAANETNQAENAINPAGFSQKDQPMDNTSQGKILSEEKFDTPQKNQTAPASVNQASPNQVDANSGQNTQVKKQTSSQNAEDFVGGGDQERNTIVDILVQQGALDSERAKQVRMAEIQTGKPQEDIIKEQNIVTQEALIKARAKYYNIQYVDLNNTPVNPEALSVLPQDVAKKFKAFPVGVDSQKQELYLAMADPLDLSAIEFIEQKTGFHIKPQAAIPSVIEEFIAKRYDTSLSQEVTAALKEVSGGPRVHTLDASKRSGGIIRQERISEVVTHILDFAIRARASDVHIEPMERVTRVRYRIDGILQEKLTIPRELHDSLVSRIKILSGMKIDEKRIPQDGRFNFRNQQQEVDLRVSTLPTSLGEKIVMRLLKKTGGVPDLPQLGLRGKALKNLEDAILRPHGIIIICGPTGSGKTTTLYSIIQRLNTPKVNIMTLEDPVEYKIAGVNQVQVNPNVGLTFASGLRSFLRQDPNIILVGEIRDSETAGLAVQASLTGHLVFATLHTTDAAGALPRLLDMGAEPFLLASSMTAIVAQRVLRKIDESSKESYQPDPQMEADIRQVLGKLYPENKPITLYRGKPTPENNNSGYKGRIGIYEVIPITDAISQLIVQGSPASQIESAAENQGMITMKQDGFLKALEGITTIEEVLRVAQD